MKRADPKEVSLSDPAAPYLVACGGDTVKIFDLTVQSGDPCAHRYAPTPGSQVNSVKWNHTNHVVASSGDDKKISLWRRNGKSLGTLQLGRNDGGDSVDESISSINFCNKGSRYLCSGGSGRIVRIWDLQKKLCIKKLSGHTDTITSVMYNCKDEHLASISLKGDLILHNLASGSQVASLKDPNGQALRVLDYSKHSRQLLVTAGDDGSVHFWDTTGQNPKVSWSKQHSAPTTGVCFSPSSDKIIASVGLDKKLYTFDSSSKRPICCVPYEAPFSSLVFRDDGYILAAGTNSGRVVFYDVRGRPQSLTVLLAYGGNEAVTGLCWQRSKPDVVDENATNEIALLGNTMEDSILMPDPLPSFSALSFPAANISGPRSSLTSAMGAGTTAKYSSSLEETPLKVKSGGSLTRLHAPRASYDLKDAMDVFSPLMEVQPITPSLSSLWDEQDAAIKDNLEFDKKSSLLPSLRKFPYSQTSIDTQTFRDWRSHSISSQNESTSSDSQSNSKPTTSLKTESIFSLPPSESWSSSNAITEKLASLREGVPSLSHILPTESTPSLSKFAGLQDMTDSSLPAIQKPLSLGLPAGAANPDVPFSLSALPRRFSTYAERINATGSFSDGPSSAVSSPKTKKIGNETRAELRQDSSVSTGTTVPLNGIAVSEPQQDSAKPIDQQQGLSSFSLQLIQRTLDETLGSVQKSIHDDVRNLHIELIRQFHMHEVEMSNSLNLVLEKQDELLKEVQLLRRENQQLRQLL